MSASDPLRKLAVAAKIAAMVVDKLGWALAAILPALIVLASDKQVVHMLEGKLHRRDQDPSVAKVVYGRHKRPVSLLMFCVGFWVSAAGLVAFRPGAFGISVALLGGICALLGVLGRMRSFHRADQELG